MADNNPPIPQRSDSLQATGSDAIMRSSEADQGTQPDLSQSQCDLCPMDYEEPNFYKETFKTLRSFTDNDQLCDVVIKCGSKSFKCHRVVLACISDYFKAMFMGEMVESRQMEVNMQNIDENVMEAIIRYAYNGKISFNIENVQSILYAASMLLIENVANACSDFMKEHLHPDNCVEVHAFAIIQNQEKLIKYAQDFLIDNFVEVSQRSNFGTVSPDVMQNLIGSDYLNVSNEIQVYEALMKWVEYDLENRKSYLPGLISKLRLSQIETHYLMEKVASNELIRASHECRDLLHEAQYYHMYLGNLTSEAKVTALTRPRKSYAGKFRTKLSRENTSCDARKPIFGISDQV